ncbi:MAG: hypothetical protein WBV98_04930, partial [Candidatus Sulfotelmatobacter sp.]
MRATVQGKFTEILVRSGKTATVTLFFRFVIYITLICDLCYRLAVSSRVNSAGPDYMQVDADGSLVECGSLHPKEDFVISSRGSRTSILLLAFFVVGFVSSAHALPAFARKYGLRCSACHESWPMLNYFGLKFKDNGYQLMNDRDSPIWQNPGYWPVTFRITPIWHRVSTGKV